MIRFRNATLPELAEILSWAANEGWNPGLDDAEAFFQADQQGFFVATDQSDALLAAISVVNHSPEFAFLGLYIVKPEYRGKGIGIGLWRHALKHAGNRTVGLDGVEAQQQNYIASGFRHAGATTRFTGSANGALAPDIQFAVAGDIPKLIEMEASASGVTKPSYLHAWFRNCMTRKTIVSRGPAGLYGFCTIRKCQSGAKIGPLIANTSTVAHQLITHSATLFGAPLTLDVPQTSAELSELCRQLGFEEGFNTARMYRGSAKAAQHANFAVCTLELG